MGVSGKINALLKLQGKQKTELAKYMGLSSTQALQNKFSRESFSAADLILISEFLGGEIGISCSGQKITFDRSDISKKLPETKN